LIIFATKKQTMSQTTTTTQIFTKEQAIEKMQEGLLLTHPFFAPGEWISVRNGRIIDECGFDLGNVNGSFWKYRKELGWNDGWILTH